MKGAQYVYNLITCLKKGQLYFCPIESNTDQGIMKTAYSEIELSAALAAGSKNAFDTVYQLYSRPVYANIFKIVCEPQQAEDLLQEVFLTLWENRGVIHNNKSVAGWLFVVSYNKAVSFLKKRVKESLMMAEWPEGFEPAVQYSDDEEALYEAQLEILQDAVDKLPSQKRKVFRLCRLEGKSYEEAAELLDISVSSVKDYLKQATRLVKSHISLRHAGSTAGIGLFLLYL